ncbi:thioredoxin family protein [Listeria booriae]|uniref:Thioredoxin family protein n=1 Tax=Listeria booriae TaxID=1552123 RepID=A0A7X1CJK6_9LIST|nr:thioredoxin family protein [Listeria booriae]MBC1780162.1 thioredoxin family protein [Listeria booriae]MBC1887636.1 thioredoxin family protein [Listeria booriae]MBC2104756.1 thioredoxin family protein [Listeria booriae]MBC2161125.1 thioredoxin family protein [Listeria booriae]MBC2181209.1 thioredoxin family protein [Listeria booriae]
MVAIWNKEQLTQNLAEQADFALYFFTPMCLGCQQTMKLVDLADETLENTLIGKMDLNYVPELAEQWEITNVPVLLSFKDGELAEVSYKLGNLIDVYEFLKK